MSLHDHTTNLDLIDEAQLKVESAIERLSVLERRYAVDNETPGDDYDPERVAEALATCETLLGQIGDLVP